MNRNASNSARAKEREFNRRTAVLNHAVREAIERHAKLGESVAIMRNGKVESVSAAKLVRSKAWKCR